jgi:hypothetical protein
MSDMYLILRGTAILGMVLRQNQCGNQFKVHKFFHKSIIMFLSQEDIRRITELFSSFSPINQKMRAASDKCAPFAQSP